MSRYVGGKLFRKLAQVLPLPEIANGLRAGEAEILPTRGHFRAFFRAVEEAHGNGSICKGAAPNFQAIIR